MPSRHLSYTYLEQYAPLHIPPSFQISFTLAKRLGRVRTNTALQNFQLLNGRNLLTKLDVGTLDVQDTMIVLQSRCTKVIQMNRRDVQLLVNLCNSCNVVVVLRFLAHADSIRSINNGDHLARLAKSANSSSNMRVCTRRPVRINSQSEYV